MWFASNGCAYILYEDTYHNLLPWFVTFDINLHKLIHYRKMPILQAFVHFAHHISPCMHNMAIMASMYVNVHTIFYFKHILQLYSMVYDRFKKNQFCKVLSKMHVILQTLFKLFWYTCIYIYHWKNKPLFWCVLYILTIPIIVKEKNPHITDTYFIKPSLNIKLLIRVIFYL